MPRPLQKSHPVTKIAQEQASGSRPSTPPDVGDQQPTAATLHVDPRVTVKKSLPKLKQDFSMRNASTLSLSTPLRMKPSPPTVAPPQETPAPPEPRAETPPPPPPVAPEPESAPVEAPKDEPETHQLETAEQPVGWVAWWYGQPATPAVPPIDIAPEPEIGRAHV